MRPINLTIVHWWPEAVSILNVTRFTSAMRGPHQKLWNNLESDREICPGLGNCSDSGEKMRCFVSATHSIRLFRNLTERGRTRFALTAGDCTEPVWLVLDSIYQRAG